MANNVIEFTLRTKDKFSKTFKSIGNTISSTAKNIASLGKKVSIAAAAMIGFVAVVANGIDNAKKFSDRIGVAVDQLSKMQFVSSQAGISTEQFNMATQRMTRRVAEATQGLGEAQGALRELNINANDFSKLGLEDQMATLADRLGEVESPADKLRLAFKLFDSEGTSMLQMLKDGSSAMKEIAKDAEFLGLVISDQAAANAEHFTDSMGRATGAIKGTSRGIANELMPILSGLANRFADTMAENRESIIGFVSKGIENIFVFVEVIKQAWDGITRAFTSVEGFSAFLDNTGRFLAAASMAFLGFGKAIAISIWEGVKAATAIIVDFGKWAIGALKAAFTGGEIQDFSDTMAQSMGDAFSTAGERIAKGIKDPIDDAKRHTVKAASVMGDALGVNMDAARTKAKQSMAAISEFGTVVTGTLGKNVANTKTFLEELASVNADWISKQESTNRTYATEFHALMMGTVDAVSDGIADSIVEGKNMAEVFSSIGKQVAKELISMWIKVAIQKTIASNTGIAATLKEGAISLAMGMKEVAVNVFKSIAAIPVIGPILAPIAVVAALASIMGLSNKAGSQGAGLAGAAHGGLTNVPNESTYLLQRGERVLSPNQNKDLTNFMSNDSGRSVVVQNMVVHILENVTEGASLENMDRVALQEKYAVPLIAAFDNLYDQGVTFEFARRNI